jgi:hypothetical protein
MNKQATTALANELKALGLTRRQAVYAARFIQTFFKAWFLRATDVHSPGTMNPRDAICILDIEQQLREHHGFWDGVE